MKEVLSGCIMWRRIIWTNLSSIRCNVPFTRKGIKTKMIREINGMRWVLCHTGSMMFAFATPEDWDFGLQDNKYGIKDHHITDA